MWRLADCEFLMNDGLMRELRVGSLSVRLKVPTRGSFLLTAVSVSLAEGSRAGVVHVVHVPSSLCR